MQQRMCAQLAAGRRQRQKFLVQMARAAAAEDQRRQTQWNAESATRADPAVTAEAERVHGARVTSVTFAEAALQHFGG